MDDAELQLLVVQAAPSAHASCRALQEEVVRKGFADAGVAIGNPDLAVYRLSRDPASGENSLLGEWRDVRGQKLGKLTFHADGSFNAVRASSNSATAACAPLIPCRPCRKCWNGTRFRRTRWRSIRRC